MTHTTEQPKPDGVARQILCPYCGEVSTDPARCTHCKGLFEPLSRQASQNSMGPWFIRDPAHPFLPGCSYETLRMLVKRGRVTGGTVLRGPSTRQFWMFARRVPSVANLLGVCHSCQAAVAAEDAECPYCHADFRPDTDRQVLGLSEVRLLPGQAAPEAIAASTFAALRPAKPSIARPAVPTAPVAGSASGGREPSASTPLVGAVVILAIVCVGLLATLTAIILNPEFILPPSVSSHERAPVSSPIPPPAEAEPTSDSRTEGAQDKPDVDAAQSEELGEPSGSDPSGIPFKPLGDDLPPPTDPEAPTSGPHATRIATMVSDVDPGVIRYGLDLLQNAGDTVPSPLKAILERVAEIRLELARLERGL